MAAKQFNLNYLMTNYSEANPTTESKIFKSASDIEQGFYSSATSDNIFVVNGWDDIGYIRIETVPGVQFYLNSSVQSCIVDSSGIFELDIRQTNLKISLLYFSKTSIENIVENGLNYLIVTLDA